eukprot:7934068-Alexandrium_andersonii.AAC.1
MSSGKAALCEAGATPQWKTAQLNMKSNVPCKRSMGCASSGLCPLSPPNGLTERDQGYPHDAQ